MNEDALGHVTWRGLATKAALTQVSALKMSENLVVKVVRISQGASSASFNANDLNNYDSLTIIRAGTEPAID